MLTFNNKDVKRLSNKDLETLLLDGNGEAIWETLYEDFNMTDEDITVDGNLEKVVKKIAEHRANHINKTIELMVKRQYRQYFLNVNLDVVLDPETHTDYFNSVTRGLGKATRETIIDEIMTTMRDILTSLDNPQMVYVSMIKMMYAYKYNVYNKRITNHIFSVFRMKDLMDIYNYCYDNDRTQQIFQEWHSSIYGKCVKHVPEQLFALVHKNKVLINDDAGIFYFDGVIYQVRKDCGNLTVKRIGVTDGTWDIKLESTSDKYNFMVGLCFNNRLMLDVIEDLVNNKYDIRDYNRCRYLDEAFRLHIVNKLKETMGLFDLDLD